MSKVLITSYLKDSVKFSENFDKISDTPYIIHVPSHNSFYITTKNHPSKFYESYLFDVVDNKTNSQSFMDLYERYVGKRDCYFTVDKSFGYNMYYPILNI